MKIGLISDSLRLDFKSSVVKAASLGVTGIQKYLTGGEFDPYDMTNEKIREIKDIMSSNGLVFSAICGDMGIDFDNVEKQYRNNTYRTYRRRRKQQNGSYP